MTLTVTNTPNCESLFALILTLAVGIWIPIFSIAFANSSGSTVPLSFKSKYLKDFMRTCCSDWAPFVFSDNLFFSSLSKLNKKIGDEYNIYDKCTYLALR